MASSEKNRSPLESVWRQIVPQGHDQTLRNAFYNIAAAGFVLIALTSAWTVYLIMQPFVQALLWAVLVGSLLHPIKHQVSTSVRSWLLSIKEVNSLLSINVILLPITWIDILAEFLGGYIVSHRKILIWVTGTIPTTFMIIHYTPTILSQSAYSTVLFFYYVTKYFLDTLQLLNGLVYTIPCAYIICLFVYYNEKTKNIFRRCSFPVWMISIAALVSTYPFFSVPLFVFFFILLAGGIFKEVKDLLKLKSVSLSAISILQSVSDICLGSVDESSIAERHQLEILSDSDSDNHDDKFELEDNNSEVTNTDSPISDSTKSLSFKSSTSNDGLKKDIFIEESKSNFYLKAVFATCVIVQIWKYSIIFTLLLIPIGYYAIKKFTSYHFLDNQALIGMVWKFLEDKYQVVYYWIEERKRALLPLPIRGVLKLLKNVDQKMVGLLSSSIDAIVTLAIILFGMVLFIIVSIFLAVQIQGEGMHLVAMGNQLVNATIVQNPQFKEMLPEDLNGMLNSATTNAYQYGRVWLSETVQNFIGETDDVKAQALEKEVIKLWDHIYQAWVADQPQSPYMGPVVTSAAVAETFDSVVNGIRQSPDLFTMSFLSDIVRDNIGTVMSVAEGIRSILMSNLNLAFSILTASISLILGGSLSILNALLNMVVFLSALFYILSISGGIYKPVAFLGDLAPGQMNTIGTAVEEAINGVFIASFKMGAFYGMWTWMLHSIFGTKIVYIPSFLGALFGAVPLLGTYWAAVPGAIELFWGHESPVLALLLILAQLLPLSCVDTAIYSEIKGGGHPYLTGLAVAGGIFCWGVEGAIFGPLVLCILLVATKMYTNLIHVPADANQRLKKLKRCQSELKMI